MLGKKNFNFLVTLIFIVGCAPKQSAINGDVFIPITTSGNSQNILSAVNYANSNFITTYCLTGNNGGLLKDICECVCVPSNKTERIQESHIMIGHIILETAEDSLI